ncbi:MAG TPA: hypothetical protein VFJ02_03115, partial [Vicinamibacterales bacterium]|nr:hypothetical protein [Vicinamibacterales bacterium]
TNGQGLGNVPRPFPSAHRPSPMPIALGALALAAACASIASAQAADSTRRIAWSDVAAVRNLLEPRGVSASSFHQYVERLHETNVQRVSEGDLDHLVFYMLQSTRFTRLPPIEPALSAKALVAALDALDARERALFLANGRVAADRIPADVRARIRAFDAALNAPSGDQRLMIFREVLASLKVPRSESESRIGREYVRAMRFVYEKEFIAQRTTNAAQAVADLYRTRGLSTDTAVEAGYLVHLGLGIAKAIDPGRRVRRVLIVGPGFDLAPRTGLVEEGPPESYQPWAVIDALLSLGLSSTNDLTVVGADINPRVVSHLRRARTSAPALTLTTEVRETDTVTLTADYRDYFSALGAAIDGPAARSVRNVNGHLQKTVPVRPDCASTVTGQPLDIVTERIDGRPFDLIVATNILPYFDDAQLVLALSNVAAMLAPNGLFLHNEARPLLGSITTALGLPFEQSRHAVIAQVRGAPAPLFDSVFVHRRRQ